MIPANSNTIDSFPLGSASDELGDWPGVVEELRLRRNRPTCFAACVTCRIASSSTAQAESHVGRYSFLAADPFDWLAASPDDAAVWSQLSQQLNRCSAPTLPDLPPFQGGLAGLFSYDLSRSIERLPRPKIDELEIAGVALGLYDVVVAFDHLTGRAWIISQGFPEQEPQQRQYRA